MVIYTQFAPPEVVFEENSGESNVDIELYRPISERIDSYIRSGEYLEDTRRLQYHTDYLNEMVNNPDWTDPLTYRGLDRVELELMHKNAIDDILQRMREENDTTGEEEPATSKPVTNEPVVNDASASAAETVSSES